MHNIYYSTGQYARIVLRPYIRNFLEFLIKYFYVLVFTAGEKKYAKSVVKLIDPKRQFISRELYRDNCTKIKSNFYVKDLRQISNEISKVILIDNSLNSFALQMDNGILVNSFVGDKNDRYLLYLVETLQSFKDCTDVRHIIKSEFGYSTFLQYYLNNT